VCDADNDVINGIRFQSQLLSNGTYKICGSCSNSIREYSSYVWDAKASAKGEDKPVKDHDHSMDAQRYALYTHFGKDLGSSLKPEDIDRMYYEATQKQSIPAVFQQPQEMGAGAYF